MSASARRPVPYPGPSFDPLSGTVRLGEAADDAPAAPAWRLYAPETMRSGLVVGAPGMGKSHFLGLLAHSAMCSRTTAVWYANPQGEVGAPHLARACDYTASNGSQIRSQFETLAQIAEARHAEGTVFTPSRETPGLLVIVEDLAAVLADGGVRSVMEATAGLWARVGIGFAASAPSLSPRVFADSVHIRRSLLHQVVFLHINQVGTGVGDGLPVPRLPRSAGHAHYRRYRAGGGLVAEQAADFRAAFLGTGAEAARWFGTVPAARPRVALPGAAAAAA